MLVLNLLFQCLRSYNEVCLRERWRLVLVCISEAPRRIVFGTMPITFRRRRHRFLPRYLLASCVFSLIYRFQVLILSGLFGPLLLHF